MFYWWPETAAQRYLLQIVSLLDEAGIFSGISFHVGASLLLQNNVMQIPQKETGRAFSNMENQMFVNANGSIAFLDFFFMF